MNVFELFAKLGLDTSEYDESLDKSESKASSFGSKLKTGIGAAAGVATAAVAATTAATVAGAKAFVEGAADVARYGDEIEKNSQKLGLSMSKYQEFDYVLNIAGTSMANMSVGMKTMTNKLDEAKNGSESALAMFQALGLSLEDLQTMTREEVFESAIYGFQGMAESTERAALANDLFGRSGQELTPLFNMTQAETKELIKTANEYGMVMSDDAVKASAGFQDSLTTMQNTMTGFKNNMMSQFLPSLSTVMDGLSLVFSGKSDSGLAKIEEGVKKLSDKMSEVVPIFVKVGGTIVTSLASAITKNLPTLLKSGAEAISQIGVGIISNMDQILPAAFSVIETIGGALLDHSDEIIQTGAAILVQLTNGLAENADEIIPGIVSVIHVLVSTLTQPEVAKPLLEGGIEIIVGLMTGLAQATPELISMIPEIIANIILTIQGEGPFILKAVADLLGSLGQMVLGSIGGLMGMSYDEIAQAFDNFIGAAKNFGTDVKNWFNNTKNNILSGVQSFFSNIWNSAKNGLNNVLSAVTGFGTKVKTNISQTFENAKNTIKNAVEAFKNFFKFDWQLPKPKLPHFSVSGGEAPWGFGGQGSLPSVSIQWYKKALNDPYFLDSATIFGAAGNKLLGGGEAGSEVIVGTDRLMSMMKQAVGIGSRPITINVYGAAGQDIRSLAKEVSKELQNLIDDQERVYA